MKNIPLPSHKEYTKRLIERTECLIRRMRWKAFYYLNPDIKSQKHETYGFKSQKTPQKIEEMKSFEEDMLGIIENIQFKQVKCDFLSRLKKDVNTIHKSNSLII